jgi:hypothetical protein
MDSLKKFKQGGTFLVESPLRFVRDPETGHIVIAFSSFFHAPGGQSFETPMGLRLTTETAQALLADLPTLEALLREATKGQSTPDSVQ